MIILDYFIETFRIFFSAFLSPREWANSLTKNNLELSYSASDLVSEYKKQPAKTIGFILQMGGLVLIIVAILCVCCCLIIYWVYGYLPEWSLRQLLLLIGATLGFGCISFLTINMGGGIVATIVPSFVAVIIFIAAICFPDLSVKGSGVFSATKDIKGLGYFLGGLSVGLCLSTLVVWLNRVLPPIKSNNLASPLRWKMIVNIVLVLSLLVGYSLLIYLIAIWLNSPSFFNWVGTIVIIPAILAIVFHRSRLYPSITWGDLLIAISPLSVFFYSCLGIIASLYDKSKINIGTPLDGVSLGLAIGAIIASFYAFTKAVLEGVGGITIKKTFIASYKIIIGILFTCFVLIISFRGLFPNFHPENRPYTIVGTAFGLGVGQLVMTLLLKKHTLEKVKV